MSACLIATSCGGGGSDDDGGGFSSTSDAVYAWNTIAIDATGLDHAPTNVGPAHTFGQQVGPCRAARAMAIIHIAMFEAANAVHGGFTSYAKVARSDDNTPAAIAIAQAAHDALVALYPSQAYIFDAHLGSFLTYFPDSASKARAIALGQTCADSILDMVANDGSAHPEPRVDLDFVCNPNPGFWRKDPVSLHPLALGAHWPSVAPLVLPSADVFRCPPFPALNSPEYTTAYNEVKDLGGDGVTTPTQRTAEQTEIGIYWAYDGTPSLCAPPRLYNQIATQLARERGVTGVDLARYLALINVSMCEAGLTSWESKWYYQIWRPVCAIRESDGGGPTGLGDGNPNTVGDPSFKPLGAPASNSAGPNFTPPFPAYPSGHATFGGAIFQTMRRYFGTDDIAFTFVSDEYNGLTVDNQGNPRPLKPRSFTNLSQPEEENGQSRIYLGIHWSFDKTAGIAQGRQVANYVFDNAFLPVN